MDDNVTLNARVFSEKYSDKATGSLRTNSDRGINLVDTMEISEQSGKNTKTGGALVRRRLSFGRPGIDSTTGQPYVTYVTVILGVDPLYSTSTDTDAVLADMQDFFDAAGANLGGAFVAGQW